MKKNYYFLLLILFSTFPRLTYSFVRQNLSNNSNLCITQVNITQCVILKICAFRDLDSRLSIASQALCPLTKPLPRGTLTSCCAQYICRPDSALYIHYTILVTIFGYSSLYLLRFECTTYG